MRAGRAAEAEPIWAAVRADTPDDVWLYNNAGLEYAHAGDHRTALDWLTEGLRLALRTSDPERLVDQLADLRQVSLDSLGRPADALQEQAMTFRREQERARQKRSPREAELAPEPTGGAVGTVALAWLPAGDYEQAVSCGLNWLRAIGWPARRGRCRTRSTAGRCGNNLSSTRKPACPGWRSPRCGWRRLPRGAPNEGDNPIQPMPGPSMPPTWQRTPTRV